MTEAGQDAGGAALLADRTRAAAWLQPRDVAYRIYIVLLVGPAAAIALEWVVLAATALLGLSLPLTDVGDLQRAATLASAGIALLTCYAVHTGAWRGPFTMDRADAAWLLGSPLPRRDLLLPRLQRAALLGAVVGGGASGVVAVVLAQVLGSAMFPAAAAAAAAGAGLGLLVPVTSWWVLLQRGRAAAVLRGAPVVVMVILAGTILALLWPPFGWVVSWSGPWGWMVRSLVAASEGRWLAAIGWAGPSLVAGLAALRWMLQQAGHAPAEALRVRSQHAAAVAAAVFLGELDAYAEVQREALAALTKPSVLRAPLPTTSQLAIPWFDVTVLLRWPGRALLAAGGGAGGAALVGIATGMTSLDAAAVDAGRALALTVVGVVVLQRAARAWMTPLRAALSSPFGHHHLPWSHAQLIRRHLTTPVLALIVTGMVGSVGAWALGAPAAGVGAAVLPLPLLALSSALTVLRPPSPPGEVAALAMSEYGLFAHALRSWPQTLYLTAAVVPPLLIPGGGAGVLAALTTAAGATGIAWLQLQRKAAPWQAG